MAKKSNAEYCREYRQRLREDPERLAVYRSCEAARRRRLRKRVPTDVPTDVPTVSANVPTDSPFDVITYLAVPKILEIKRREVALREKCSAAYERILSGPDVEFPAESAGGLHSSPANQGRSFVSGEPCLRTPEVIEREWHSIWGEGDEH